MEWNSNQKLPTRSRIGSLGTHFNMLITFWHLATCSHQFPYSISHHSQSLSVFHDRFTTRHVRWWFQEHRFVGRHSRPDTILGDFISGRFFFFVYYALLVIRCILLISRITRTISRTTPITACVYYHSTTYRCSPPCLGSLMVHLSTLTNRFNCTFSISVCTVFTAR